MYPMNQNILQAKLPLTKLGQKLLLRFAMVALFLLGGFTVFAQHDVALAKSVDRDSVAAGDTVTWTIRLTNENSTNVAGLQVRDTLLPGLTYISHSAPNGTTYNTTNGVWMVGTALDANTPELILTIKTRVEWEGMYMNIAEVIDMAGTDMDSEPDNEELLEDDMDKACVSVPITICSNLNDSVRVTLLPMFTDIQWYKDGILIPASQGGTQDTFYITQAGIFAFTATQNGCPTLTCCPVVVKDSCYDLALRKTLAAGQNDTVNVGDLVQFTLEIFNQGDLPARLFSIIDHVDLSFFAPFNTASNPPGNTSGDATIPYAWSSAGTNGKVALNGELSPGESVQLPVTLKVAHGGQATNFAEIFSDDDRDQDSQPDSQEQDGNADNHTDNVINNNGGDEDDHDGASLTIIASAIGDYVWNDNNHDGQQDPSETGVPSIIIHLYTADSTLVATDTTDANGGYFFPDLPPGNYYVEFEIATVPPGFEPTTPNTGNDITDSDPGPSGWTGIIKLDPGEVDTTIDMGIFGGQFDLALTKNLAPGQSNLVDIGEEVSYYIAITNEGNAPAANIQISDHIPAGLALSANNPGWTLVNDSTANYTLAVTLQPGQSDSVLVKMIVLYGASGASLVNMAEIVGAEDENGVFINDNDSTPNNGNPGEDDLDDEVIELEPHDPTGWIYCDKTGRIIPGGRISVTGPNGIPNSQVFIIHDGSEGYYEFYTNGTPGVYSISYSHPLGFPLSPDCPPSAGPFDPTGMVSPVVLGSDTLNVDYIEDKTCAGNPFYMSFAIQPGDPIILHNNLPVQCILIASIACEDTNNNDTADAGDLPIAGATVYLYDCANTTTPIMTSITDAEGHYRFDGLEPGSYRVGYQLTPDIRPVANGVIDANGFSPCINLTWGQCDTNTVICLYECPDVDAGPDFAHCNNTETSQLSASMPYGNGTFTWSPTNGLSNPNIANPFATPSASTTYTVTFNDGRGCVDTDAMNISIGNPSPILSYTPWADTTVDCTSPLTPFEAPTFDDGCDDNLSIVLDSTVTNNPCGRTIVRTWTATNDNGNSVSFTQTVTVEDNTPPVMFATHAFFGEIHHGDTLYADCTQIPSLDSLGFSTYDFCSATTHNFTENVIDGNCAVDGFLENRYCGWTATDACGNTDSLYFRVIITDNLPPTLAGVPANIDMPCGQAAPPVASVTASDLCSGSLPVSFIQTQTGSGCATTITRTWTAVDACGNIATASQTINVSTDNQPPVLANIPANTSGTCGNIPPVPANITATDNCDNDVQISFNESISGSACNYTITRTWTATDDCGLTTTRTQVISLTDDDTPVLVGVPTFTTASCGYVPAPPAVTATDGCDSNVAVTFSESQVGTGCSFTLTRRWTATDDCGHTATATQVINVVDDRGPEISVIVPNLTWLSDGDTLVRQCNQVISLTANSAVAQDACCSAPPTMDFHEYVTAGNCQTDGFIQRMVCGWVATDCCGNVDSLFFTVILTDTIPPKFYGVPADVTLACGQTPSATLPNVVAQDNCSNNVAVVFNSTTVNTPGGYILTRTWSATDGCGNVGTKSQTITVTLTDVVPPALANVPPNLNLDCGATIPPAANNVTATDFCDATPTISFNETSSGTTGCQTITRTWTATDDAGNVSIALQTITVTDGTAPVLAGVPASATVDCASIPAPANVTATDNCDASVSVTYNQTQQGSGCNYTLTRTWTATDDCGNQTVAQQIITVNDVVRPVFAGALPQNMAVDCSNIPAPASLTATDNCDVNVAVIYNQTQQGSGCNQTLTRTWMAIDDCGNQTVAQQILTVTDTTPPVMYAVHAFFGEIRHGDTLYADCSQIASLDSIGFSATDACGETTRNFTETVTSGNCATDGFFQSRYCGWTASDACGNTDSLYFTVIISDQLPPTLVGVPGFATAACGQVPPPANVTATDNCGQVPVTLQETTAGTGCNRTLNRTWTATDNCGNTVTASQTIALSDTEAPVLVGVLPQNLTLSCLEPIPAAATLTATDNCDDSVAVVLQVTQVGTGCDYALTRTWTATDACGNSVVHTQVITVSDTSSLHIVFTEPLLAGLENGDTLTISCNDPALFDASDAIGLDGCSAATIAFTENSATPGNCLASLLGGDGFINIMHCTWTATDSCGNSASITLHIATVDHEAPVFSNLPDDITIGCDEPLPPCGNPTATDNCGDVILSENTATVATANGYDRICTWRATDGCGNTTTATRTIHVIETGTPFISSVPADTTIYLANGGTMPPVATVTATEGCPAQPITVEFTETVELLGNDGCLTKVVRTWMATTEDGETMVQQQEITVVGSNNATVASVVPDTCGSGVGGIVLAPPSYTYVWGNGAVGATQNGLAAGGYTVTATNGTCAKVLTVTIPNVQIPLTITAINTTPQTCAGVNGTAAIAPATLTYAWSDGGTGATRTGLAAGSYNVTATDGPAGAGNCATVFVVNIENGCNCEPAVLSSLPTTNTSCGVATGTATLNIAGNIANYGFLWTPDLGTSNGLGNARTGLPASHYVVLVTYQGNSNCVEKFEFDIFDDCPKCAPVFPMAEMTVEVSKVPTKLCLPVPLAVLAQSGLRVDGQPYTVQMEGCDNDDVVKYGFDAFPVGQLQVHWQLGTDKFYTISNDLASVVAFMNYLDADGNWHFDAANSRFVSSNLSGAYGKLQITHLPTGNQQASKVKLAKAALGTRILLAEGQHLLTLGENWADCADSMMVTVKMRDIVVVADVEGLQAPSNLQPDLLRTRQGEAVTGDVLANDQLNRQTKQLRIASQPANGTAWVNVDNTVSYRPLVAYCDSYQNDLPEQFTYEVCFDNGTKLQATVTVEVECREDEPYFTEIALYPNPASDHAYLDVSALAGQSVRVQVYSNLGRVVRQVDLEEAPTAPVRLDLDGLAAGHYAVWIRPAAGKPFVRQLIIAED